MEHSLKSVLITDPIDPICVKILKDAGIVVVAMPKCPPKEELMEMIKNYNGLIVRSGTKVTRDIIRAGKGRLKLIGRAGTGVDDVDVDAATECGTMVMSTPAGNTISAAEHTCAMMTALARHIAPASVSLKEGKWDRKSYMGTEMKGKTLGLLGVGRVGREVATRMKAYGMRVIGADPYVSASQAAEWGIQLCPIYELWPGSDYISIHTPLLDSTKGMVNSAAFSCCKKGVRIVNVARGGIIDNEALLKALNDGIVDGAALDVFEEEPPISDVEWNIIKHPKVLATPHLGASTKEAQVRVAEEIAHQFVAFHKGKELKGLVNGTHMDQGNSPDMVSWVQLTSKLARVGTGLSGGPTKEIANLEVHVAGVVAHKSEFLSIVAVLGTRCEKDGMNLLSAGKFRPKDTTTADPKSKTNFIKLVVNGIEVQGTVVGEDEVPTMTSIRGVPLPNGVPLVRRLGVVRGRAQDVVNKCFPWTVFSPDHTYYPGDAEGAADIERSVIIKFNDDATQISDPPPA